jgi:DNA-binding transcriptional LysR family regulator
MEEELSALASAARKRRSADLFLGAALEGFCWALLAGVCAKLLWDSRHVPPLFFWPLALIDVWLLWDAARRFREGRRCLRREVLVEARVRELRAALGIDP